MNVPKAKHIAGDLSTVVVFVEIIIAHSSPMSVVLDLESSPVDIWTSN